MKTLTFTHTFPNGKDTTLTVIRFKFGLPKITCSRKVQPEEHDEYIAWRASILAALFDTLTPSELRAFAEHAMNL